MNLLQQWLSYPAALDRILSIIGIEIHWLILQYVLGLPLLILVALIAHKRSGDWRWERMARTMAKALALVFSVGAAMGTVSEFGLVVVWPNLLEAAGRYIYFPLYLEIFAFLTEIVFIFLLVFMWNRLSVNARIAVALLVIFGAWFSGAMITSVNSYMVAPTGITAAYDPFSGWKYDQGYPKVLLVVPKDIVGLLDVGKLQSLGMDVVGSMGDGVAVRMPSKIVARLAAEAWGGVTVKDSILSLVLKPEAAEAVGNLLVKDVVDTILLLTVRTVGYTTVTFQSPVYPGTLIHSIGAALTVTAFTVIGAYSLLLLRSKDEKSREYYLLGIKFGAISSLVFILLQGVVFGHLMGEEIARYNPEKLAAMEGTSSKILSISRLLGIEKLMSFIAYGSFDAKLPSYDGIPLDYCSLMGVPAISDCRPPLMLHYLYYTKTGLAILLGLYSLVLSLALIRGANPRSWLLWSGVLSAPVAQLTSFLGWAVREIGRKPWSIYGVMTVDVAHTANPADPAAVALIAVLFLLILAGLVIVAWRVLYSPSVKGG